ncbi:MAG: hypothetical protein DRI95_00050 [Bacteroidetes bacterium]|nr:MAG: hypothetical protein DRI95_00050 [Bacteroidota bacterium]
MKTNKYFRIAAISLLMTALSIVFDLIFNHFQNPISYAWQILANLLIAGTLALYIFKSKYSGLSLFIKVFIIYYVIGYFNIIIEAIIFNVSDLNQSIKILLIGLPYTAISSYLIVWILGKWQISEKVFKEYKYQHRPVFKWILRILGANFSYFPFYIIAGMILMMLNPAMNEFYGDKIPPFLTIAITNLFFRGFVFAAIAILINKTLFGTQRNKAIITGLIFAIIGGIAPLITPNDLMPYTIRLGHGFEVGISNYVFGYIISYMLRQKISLN